MIILKIRLQLKTSFVADISHKTKQFKFSLTNQNEAPLEDQNKSINHYTYFTKCLVKCVTKYANSFIRKLALKTELKKCSKLLLE